MRIVTFIAMLALALCLFSDNEMDIVWTVDGEQWNAQFGYYLAALDFNGDGYDDLAVSAPYYHVNEEYSNYRGKLYLYWGSEDGLSETCDYTITTAVDTTLRFSDNWLNLRNLGDMNGDGCEDLGYRYGYRISDPYQSFSYIGILFGSVVYDTIPDFAYRTAHSLPDMQPLGDINGDGCTDVGIIDSGSDEVSYTILYGNTFETFPLTVDRYNRGGSDLRGLGDINGDGFDDFYYHFTGEGIPQPNGGSKYPYHDYVFYGAAVQDTIPDVHLTELRSSRYGYLLYAAGDFNGDGFDDFHRTTADNVDGDYSGIPLWRGGEEIHWDWYSYLEYEWYDFYSLHGDLNGDGFSDIIYRSGDNIKGYLGGQNGTEDLYIRYNEAEANFLVLTIGDFDGDGCDDIAAGDIGYDPCRDDHIGSAFVFAGNTGLAEQDPEAAEEQTVSPVSVEMNAYPNPFNPEICFDIKAPECRSMHLEFFNIRGQMVDSIELNRHASSITWKPENLASGVYMCRLKADGRVVARKKITLMK